MAADSISSPDLIYSSVIRGLYEGTYAPGQRLIEPAMMREHGTSRSSVREAFSRLAAEGIISLSRYRGAHIRLLGAQEAIDILQLLEMILGLAARLAAMRIHLADHGADFMRAVEHLLAFEQGGDPASLNRCRNRFYKVLIRIANNREVERVMPSMQVHLLRTQFQPSDEDGPTARLGDYRDIAEAVLAGEPNWAEKMTRQHVANVRMALVSAAERTAADASEP